MIVCLHKHTVHSFIHGLFSALMLTRIYVKSEAELGIYTLKYSGKIVESMVGWKDFSLSISDKGLHVLVEQ